MMWKDVLEHFGDTPLFHATMLGIFQDHESHRQVQLSRWVRSGKLHQVRRGWYLIAAPYRRRDVPPEVIAATVVHPAYLSLDWALHYYDMIPEFVPNPTLITTRRTRRIAFRDRLFIYHHVRSPFFFGYRRVALDGGTVALADREKALLDKIYLFCLNEPLSREWLMELRLQNLDDFDLERFAAYADRLRAARFAAPVALSLRFLRELKEEQSS